MDGGSGPSSCLCLPPSSRPIFIYTSRTLPAFLLLYRLTRERASEEARAAMDVVVDIVH